MEDLYKYERNLNKQNIFIIGGVDEVGRGPLVGPVVAACVVLPTNFYLEGLTDSKKLTEKKRDKFYNYIKENALSYGIGVIDEKRIDEINIYEATKEAMTMAIKDANKKIKIEHILIDAMPLKLNIPSTSIIKGDAKSISIAAASVIAKVTRDKMMYELDQKYPMYDFKSNKGYPTKKHIEAINQYGIIKEHRKTYGPAKEYLEKRISSRAIIMEADSIYLMYRRKLKEDNTYKEYYALPGGGQEQNETKEETVVRELKEEFGCNIKIKKYLGKKVSNKSIEHFFNCEIIHGIPKLGGEEKERCSQNNYYEIRKVPIKDLDKIDIYNLDIIMKAYNTYSP